MLVFVDDKKINYGYNGPYGITTLVTNSFSLTSDNEVNRMTMSLYDAENDEFYSSYVFTNMDDIEFSVPINKEIVFDFKNNKTYIDDEEIQFYVYDTSFTAIPLNISTITNVIFE